MIGCFPLLSPPSSLHDETRVQPCASTCCCSRNEWTYEVLVNHVKLGVELGQATLEERHGHAALSPAKSSKTTAPEDQQQRVTVVGIEGTKEASRARRLRRYARGVKKGLRARPCVRKNVCRSFFPRVTLSPTSSSNLMLACSTALSSTSALSAARRRKYASYALPGRQRNTCVRADVRACVGGPEASRSADDNAEIQSRD